MDRMRFHQSHPYLFVGVLEATVVGAFIAAGALTRRLGLPQDAVYWIGFVFLTMICFVLLTRMRWWKEVGFRPLGEYCLLWLPALPLIGTLVQFSLGGDELVHGTVVLFMLVLTALNGFVEEVFYRGLMLRALVRKGMWRALVVTSLIFAFTHSMNVLTGWSPERVVWQLCYSFALGFGWAAFALHLSLKPHRLLLKFGKSPVPACAAVEGHSIANQGSSSLLGGNLQALVVDHQPGHSAFGVSVELEIIRLSVYEE
jgi:membrane protease YdiL (CAAX protease family)